MEVGENAESILRTLQVKAGIIGRDPTSPGAVGCCTKDDEPHPEDRPDPVTGPHGALAYRGADHLY